MGEFVPLGKKTLSNLIGCVSLKRLPIFHKKTSEKVVVQPYLYSVPLLHSNFGTPNVSLLCVLHPKPILTYYLTKVQAVAVYVESF
jgi:hypothetical protein